MLDRKITQAKKRMSGKAWESYVDDVLPQEVGRHNAVQLLRLRRDMILGQVMVAVLLHNRLARLALNGSIRDAAEQDGQQTC